MSLGCDGERTENRDGTWPSYVGTRTAVAWKSAVEFQIGNEWVWSMGGRRPPSRCHVDILVPRPSRVREGLSRFAVTFRVYVMSDFTFRKAFRKSHFAFHKSDFAFRISHFAFR